MTSAVLLKGNIGGLASIDFYFPQSTLRTNRRNFPAPNTQRDSAVDDSSVGEPGRQQLGSAKAPRFSLVEKELVSMAT